MGAGVSCERPVEYPVVLHIYELGNEASMLLSTLGAGGIYHTGVEIGGKEYAFGDTSGVWTQQPGRLPESFGSSASYRGTENLGNYSGRPSQLRRIVSDLKREFPPSRYELLSCNCNHFSTAMCGRLGVNAPPAYINQLAATGTQAASMAAGFGALAAGFLGAAAVHMEGELGPAAASGPGRGPIIERLDDED